MLWPESTQHAPATVRRPDGTEESLGRIDVAFPILHGPFGEDGTIQGLFELIGLPYVGNGVLASALGMDKHFTKTVLQAAGVPVAPWVTLHRSDRAGDPTFLRRRIAALGYPVFVKPARAGSSVGVSKVDDAGGARRRPRHRVRGGLAACSSSARSHGRELEIGMLGSRTGGAARTSAVGEVVVTGRAFYDFDAKYLDAPGRRPHLPRPPRRRRADGPRAHRASGRSRRSTAAASPASTSSSPRRASS